GAFLAACGISGQATSAPTSATTPGASTVASEAPSVAASEGPGATINSGELNWANWIGYIDVAEDGTTHPTIEKFTKETTIQVNYQESIDANETFFTRDLSGPLSANPPLPTQWDLIVVTDWMVARLVRLGWLEKINYANTPNFPANLVDTYKARSFDPNTDLAAPWQSGMTGIGFDKKKTGDLTSINVFFDPKYKGKMEYQSEMRDTVGLVAILNNIDPGTITQDQFNTVIGIIKKAVVDDKLVRAITGNSYVEDMAAGDALVAMAWSGDVLTLLVPDEKPDQDFQWALPTEGGMLWTDNMCMPLGAKNKGQAEAWINFYYNPDNAAAIEDYVNYVCPVKGAKDVLLKNDPTIANNPLVFPPDDWLARVHQFRALTADEEQSWSKAFDTATGH
ncbi:MAG TPA: spermidine/putrescine ABC transporter substrate-binding protein, partial [Candidatus Limnocylindrales bacterium]